MPALQNMWSVEELENIGCASHLGIKDGGEGSSSNERRFGNDAYDHDTTNDGHIFCKQPQDFNTLFGATFLKRVWPDVMLKHVLLLQVVRNEPTLFRRWHIFHHCFESVFQTVHYSLDLERGKRNPDAMFTQNALITDCLQRAIRSLKMFGMWVYVEEVFVHFTHFWLFERPSDCKANWLQFKNLKDKLSFSLVCGFDVRKKWPWDLTGIFSMFCKYPMHLVQTS